MILNGYQIDEEILKNKLVVNASVDCLNAASLDIRLGRYIMVESPGSTRRVYLGSRQPLTMYKVDLDNFKDGYALQPGQFILASSEEVFNLPNHISAEYKLKSSMARVGLEHLNAGWCDAGWHGSVLTLELKNMTSVHQIIIKRGDKIGQMVFFKHDPVGLSLSYAVKGSYNNDKEVQVAKTESSIKSNSSPDTEEIRKQLDNRCVQCSE